MLEAVRRYATRVLLIHGALLILVIGVVLGAARQVQISARAEEQNKERERLEILADEAASGFESHYRSILSVLDVVLHDDSGGTATMPAPPQGPGPGGRGGFGGRGGGFGGRGGRGILNRFTLNGPVSLNDQTLRQLWRQLGGVNGGHGAVSQLFVVDTQRGAIFNPLEQRNNGAAGAGLQQFAYVYPQGEDNVKSAQGLLSDKAIFEWIKGVTGAEMSGYQPGAEGGFHLIALPAEVGGGIGGPGGFGGGFGGPGFGGRGGIGGNSGAPPEGPPPGGRPVEGAGTQSVAGGPARFVLVVVVPISTVAEEFLVPLNPSAESGGSGLRLYPFLVNDSGQVLWDNPLVKAGHVPAISGADTGARDALWTLISPRASDAVESKGADSALITAPFYIGNTRVSPQIVASAQFGVPSGKRWTVLLSSPLSDSDVVVNRVFKSAAWWALFVTLSVTAILVSTSAFLITTRVRMERSRHELLTRELEQARHIQLAWLPDMKTVPAGIEISAVNLPASHISGDFYNWFALPARVGAAAGAEEHENGGGRVAIVIGDVTGHGMAAAFLMATTQLLVRMTLLRHQDIGRCLREVNRQLCAQAVGGTGGFQGQFVTMLVVILDTKTGQVEIGSAGHPMPLVERVVGGEKKFESVEMESQLVLGVNPEEEYQAHTLTAEPGASIVLYTDGVVEAERSDGRQYGVANLIYLLEQQERGKDGGQPGAQTRAILEDVKKFCAGQELHDDLTLVAVRGVGVGAEVGRG